MGFCAGASPPQSVAPKSTDCTDRDAAPPTAVLALEDRSRLVSLQLASASAQSAHAAATIRVLAIGSVSFEKVGTRNHSMNRGFFGQAFRFRLTPGQPGETTPPPG